MADGASSTRQSTREHVQTPNAREWREDTIELMETVPDAPQSKRTETTSHLKYRIVATKARAIAAKTGQRSTTAAPLNQWAAEKATTTTNMQIKVLTDLVKSLLKAMEEQKLEQAKQIASMAEQKQML